MSNYVQNNLGRDEQIVCEAKISVLAAIDKIIAAIFALIIAIALFIVGGSAASQVEEGGGAIILSCVVGGIIIILIGAIPLIVRFIDIRCTQIAVTNKRVIGKKGIIRIQSVDLHIEKVDTVKVEASFWGRIFKFYKLQVTGSGEGNPVWFVGVSNANEFKNAVNEAVEQYAEEARKAQAAEIAAAMAAAQAAAAAAAANQPNNP